MELSVTHQQPLALDPEQEKAVAHTGGPAIVKVAMTDVPVIPLYQPVLEVVMQPDISGYAYMFHRQVDATTLSRG